MKRTLLILAALGLVLACIQTVDRAQSTDQGTPGDPRKVEKILDELETKQSRGQTHVLQEADLNAFLTAGLREQRQNAVKELSVKLQEGFFTTYLTVDMDKVEIEGESMTVGLFRALLQGTQKIEVEGDLQAEKGMGTFKVRQARLNDYPIPAVLINAILSAVGKRQEPPFDPTEPFEMPNGIQSVKIEPGKVIIAT